MKKVPDGDTSLRLKSIDKIFYSLRGRRPALRNINLKIKEQEFFVLLGPSGCGKSTLLNVIAGLERPTNGELWFGDRCWASPKSFAATRDRNIAMVFQNYALYPHLKVYDNIAFGLRIQKESRPVIDREVRRSAEILGIAGHLEAKPRELSGGERQRVAIARAIVRRPSVFLLDEPLSNLDAQLRASMRQELRELHRRLKITTVYVTHDQVEAMTLGDRVAVFRDGALMQTGTPEELYGKPAVPFVARFIGTPPMNLIKAELREKRDRYYDVRIGSQTVRIPDTCGSGAVSAGPCLFGVRPEHLSTGRMKGGVTLKARLETCEFLGREKLVYLTVEGQRVFALEESVKLTPGETTDISLQPESAYLFPPENNQASSEV